MSGYIQTVVVGNVGRDAELRYTPNGKAVANFSVAVTRKWGSGDQKQEATTWVRVTVWDKQAEVAKEYVKKGMQILVVGTPNVSAYTNKAGEAAASLELTAQTMQFLGQKGDGNNFAPQYDEHGFPIGDSAAGQPAADAAPEGDQPEFSF